MNKSTIEEESVCIQDKYKVNKYIKPSTSLHHSQYIFFFYLTQRIKKTYCKCQWIKIIFI